MKALAGELAKGIKTEKDLGELSGQLMKLVVETALGAEMEAHLGYAKNDASGRGTGNSRNGGSSKTLKSQHGHLEVRVVWEGSDR